MITPTLGRRALNRAMLARQALLDRTESSPLAMIEQLVGLQAQASIPPYFGLWSRLQRFAPDDLSALLLDRRAVRLMLMRGTVHLVSAADGHALRPLVQPTLTRYLTTAWRKQLDSIDLAELEAHARTLLRDAEQTAATLGATLAERWPVARPASLTNAAKVLIPLVQTPPRGIWGHGGQPTYATLETWVDAGPPLTIDGLVRRYLGAFGPATVADAQTWSGLTRLKEVVDRLRPELMTFRTEDGAELFDLPEAPRPGPDVPAPPRLIAEFDNILLSHADRTRVISAEYKQAIATKNGLVPGTILIDGAVHGTWKLSRAGSRKDAPATLTLNPFAPVAAEHRQGLADEAARLLAFAAPTASAHDVVGPI